MSTVFVINRFRTSLLATCWVAIGLLSWRPATVVAQAGGEFQSFIARVEAASSGDRSAIVDSFMSAASFPYIESDTAVFIHRGSFSSISVAGDMTGWNPSIELAKLADTDFWFSKQIYESTARIDYKLITNGSNWILDPRNPRTAPGGFGPNSELAMSEYVQPWEIEQRDGVSRGTMVDTVFASAALGNSRRIQVYLPSGYNPESLYRMILFHDGTDYLSLGSVVNVLDNLISDKLIEPVVAVFVPPVDRTEEYGTTKTSQYEDFIVDEVMPWLSQDYAIGDHPTARAITGPSLGGLISTQICYRNPEVFGNCGPFSPSYWVNNEALMNEVLNGDVVDVKWYLDWGTYEPSIATTGNEMAMGLETNGYAVRWNEWHEGHSWGSWRAHIDDMLLYFYPKATPNSVDQPERKKSLGLVNYPNPFSTTTTIEFKMDRAAIAVVDVYDITGRKVGEVEGKMYESGPQRVEFSSADLSSGTYFARISTDGEHDVATLVVRR